MPSFYTLFLAALLALANVAAAAGSVQPPACLLAALQKLPNPADFAAVCGTEQTYVERNLTKVCTGADVASAYSAYSATCLASAGMTVKALETASSTQTGTATAKTTATTLTTATGTHKTTAAAGATGTSGVDATATASGSAAAATATHTGSSSTSAAGLAAAPLPGLLLLSGLLVSGLASLLLL